MKRIIILLAVTIVGGAGWALGARDDIGMAWLLSSVGSLAGLYLGLRINRAYLD